MEIHSWVLRISSWGESHGGGIGVVVDGCPPRLNISEQDIQPFLDRRKAKPGQSKITTPRKESDQVEILSGIFEGKTFGNSIAMLVRNKDARPQAYEEMKTKFRPSHADFTYQTKYGFRNHEGGGRSSARETIARVAAGAIAQKHCQVMKSKLPHMWIEYIMFPCLNLTSFPHSIRLKHLQQDVLINTAKEMEDLIFEQKNRVIPSVVP